MDKPTLEPYGRLEKYLFDGTTIFGRYTANINYHVFVFYNIRKTRYEYVAVTIDDRHDKLTTPYEEQLEGRWISFDDNDRLKRLSEILAAPDNLGYNVFIELEGYWQWIKLRRAEDSRNWYVLAQLASEKKGKLAQLRDPHFHVQPFGNYELLLRQYKEHLAYRIQSRKDGQPNGVEINEMDIECSLIDYLMEDLKDDKRGEDYKPEGDIETENAEKYLKWLAQRKSDLEKLRETERTSGNQGYEDAKKWFDESNSLLTDNNAKEFFLNYEIERTQDSIKNAYLKNFPLLDSISIKKYEGGVKYLKYLQNLSQPLLPEETKESKEKIDLTVRLLIIRYLQGTGLFPAYNSQSGHTKKQFEKFTSVLISESEGAVKKGFQRVESILKNKGLTKENKFDRINQLNRVSTYFAEIDNREIVAQVKKLISEINKKELV